MANEFKVKNGVKFPDNTIQTTASQVVTVAGKSGAVTLTPTDVPGTMSYHGFVVPYEVSLSYNKTTRQVTITPNGPSFDVWVGGVKYTKTGAQASTAHPETTDQHFLYYNTSGELEWSTTPWDIKVVSPVCEVYYDTIPADGIALNELHTYKRNPEWHESQHFAIGTFVRSGLEISGYTLNGDGNTAVTFQVAAGIIVDEDIEFAISTLADNGPYTVVRRSGASGYTWDSANTVPYLIGTNYISYNQNNGGTWQMTEGANSRWVNYYLYATTAIETAKRLFLVPGQAIHTSLSSAQAEGNASLDLTGLGLSEFVCVWKLTYATGNAYTATGCVRLVEVNRITNTRGALSVNLSTTNHALLTGRDTVDSHPASAISNVPAGNIAATDVQAAINELDSEKAATGHTHAQLHDPVTVSDTTSIDLTLTGQQISAAAKFGTTAGTVAEGNHTHSYQPLDADLTAIAGLSGTSGLLKKTAADTWSLDTTAYTTNLGTVTSVSGTGTVNGLSLSGTVSSSGSLTLGGTLDLSSPPAIGGTAAAAVSSTNLSYTGTLTGSTGVLNIGSGQIYKDTSGNVGLGDIPLDRLYLSFSQTPGLDRGIRIANNDTSGNSGSPNTAAITYGYLSGSIFFDTAKIICGTYGSQYLLFNVGSVDRLKLAGDGNATLTGNLSVTGNTTLGDASGDTVAIRAGTAALPTLIPAGDTNTGLWFPAADTVAWSTAGSERLRITSAGTLLLRQSSDAANTSVSFNTTVQNAMTLDSSGNLLVGTTTARGTTTISSANVTPSSAGNGQLVLTVPETTVGSGGQIQFGGFYTGTYYSSYGAIKGAKEGGTNAGYLAFYSEPNTGDLTERLRITSAGTLLLRQSSNPANTSVSFNTTVQNALTLDSSGNLLVGQASNSTFNAGIVLGKNSGNTVGQAAFAYDTTYYWNVGTYSNGAFLIYRGSDNAGVFISWGATSWAANSDERIKTDLKPITDAIQKVASLRSVTGRFKTDEAGVSRAFLIAQDVQSVLPEAVDIQDDEIGTLGLRYTDTIPLLVAAIKELHAEIEQLKQRT